MADPYDIKVSLRDWVEPEPFECVVCRRMERMNRWGAHRQFRAPICLYCSNTGGLQVRAVGMTRGDHFVMQRLKTIADELGWAANREARRGRGLAF